MKVVNLKINDIFETHSGERFKILGQFAVIGKKKYRNIIRLSNNNIHTELEFENTIIKLYHEKINKPIQN